MKKLAVVISATLLLTSTASLAEVYVGAKAGKSWLNEACLSSINCDDEDKTIGAFLGYEVWDILSIEAGYDYLGKFTASGLNDDKVTAITLAPKVNLPITDTVSLYGKFGGAFVEYGNQEDYSYLGAAGLEFMSNDNISVRLEYQYISDINNEIVRASGNSATLGIVYKFGNNEKATQPVVLIEERPQPKPVIKAEIVEKEVVKPIITTETFKTKKLNSNSFESNSTALTEESKQNLTNLVDILSAYPKANVEITGYTDSTGSASYNQIVSEERALSVANELVAKGIDVSRILIEGEGENNPIASNKTKEGRQQNRRVEITIPEFDYQAQK